MTGTSPSCNFALGAPKIGNRLRSERPREATKEDSNPMVDPIKSDERRPLFRYRFGTAVFDEAQFELRVAGLAVEIQRKQLEVLALLLLRADEVVAKEYLLDTVWEGRPTVDNVVA